MALEKKTVRGTVRAKCPKCDKWKAYDVTAFYFHAGSDETYLGHCRECERERSNRWHAEHPRKAKKKATAKKR